MDDADAARWRRVMERYEREREESAHERRRQWADVDDESVMERYEREREETAPERRRRWADVDAESQSSVSSGRRVITQPTDADDFDFIPIPDHPNPPPVGQRNAFYFGYIVDYINQNNQADHVRIRTGRAEMLIDFVIPTGGEEEFGAFKLRVVDIVAVCMQITHFTLTMDMTIQMMGGGDTREIARRQIADFIVNDTDGRPCFRFVHDDEVFWERYAADEIGIIDGVALLVLTLRINAPPDRVDFDIRTANAYGRRFPFQLDDAFAEWQPLLAEAQIYIGANIGSPTEHCLIHALAGHLTDDQLAQIKCAFNKCQVGKKTLEYIAEHFDCTIVVHARNKTWKTQHRGQRVIDVDLWAFGMARHYIPHRPVDGPAWMPLAHKYNVNVPCADASGTVMLIDLIQPLIDAGAFHFPTVYFPYHDYTFTLRGARLMLDLDESVVNNADQYERIEIKKAKGKGVKDIWFADFECLVTEAVHKPFCICFEAATGNQQYAFYGLDCKERFLAFLDALGRDVIVYFHNLAYDGRFLVDGSVSDLVMKGKNIYQMALDREGERQIVFRDSLALIPARLGAFPKMFGLTTTGPKEIFPYHYYTEQSMFRGDIAACGDDERPMWDDETKNRFVTNLSTLGLIEPDGIHFNAQEYCVYYCKRDVRILKEGFMVFRQQCLDDFHLDVTDSLTISSLAYRYVERLALDRQNIFSYNGFIREWIRRAVLGGRCMTRQNMKWMTSTPLVDFDACSLYPSAMHRLLIPKGTPKFIPRRWLNYAFLDAHTMLEDQVTRDNDRFISCYVVRIRISRNNVARDFPLIYKRGRGTLTYVNDDDVEMVVSHIYLQDLVRYHQIEFTIVEGIYWEGNRSTKLSETIAYIYNKRAELKRAKNPKETIYKLMMNSSYGKTIQKMFRDGIQIMNAAQLTEIKLTAAETIRMIEKIDDDHFFVVTYPEIDDMRIPVIIGCLILDMSKRIMNEVFDCCHSQGIPVFYQDTDSIHIPKDMLPRLVETFESRHGRVLIGAGMGQFHSDFPPVADKESWAIKSIFCGKKCYYDKLTNEDGVTVEHYRLKGVPQDVVEKKAQDEYGGSVEALYTALYEGEEITFNLLSTRDRFAYTNTFRVVNVRDFIRKVKFK